VGYPRLRPALEAIPQVIPAKKSVLTGGQARPESGYGLLAAPQGADKLAELHLAPGQLKKSFAVALAVTHPAEGYASRVAIYPEALKRGEARYAA